MTIFEALIIVSSALAAISTVFGVLGFYFAQKAIIQVKAMKESTHSIQYVPIDPESQDDTVLNKNLDDQEDEIYEDLQDANVLMEREGNIN